jgi:hypothetical protein
VEAFIDSALASQNIIEAAGKESQNNEHCNNGLQQQNYNGNNNNGVRPNQSVIDEGNAYLAELGAGGY